MIFAQIPPSTEPAAAELVAETVAKVQPPSGSAIEAPPGFSVLHPRKAPGGFHRNG